MVRYRYLSGVAVAWPLLFAAGWAHCIAANGFLLGVGIGWFAAALAASVLCWAWPLLLLLAPLLWG